MFQGRRVAVVVPAFNEERRIGKVVRTLPAFVDFALVVDDASTDATSAAATSSSTPTVRVLRHPINRGVGASIVTGYRAALDGGADIVVVMAGDGQMDPADLPRLLAPVARGEADYAKGDRMRHPSIRTTMPLPRRVVGKGLAWLTAKAAGLEHLSDSQSGYTAISADAIRALDLDALYPRYGYPNQLIGMLAAKGLRIRDVVVRPVYAGEKSGLRAWHVVRIVRLIAAIAVDRRADRISRRADRRTRAR